MKIEINNKDIDKLIKKRVTEFNKKIRELEAKLQRRENKIRKLERELEVTKGQMMDQGRDTASTIAKLAQCLVHELENANWVANNHHCTDCDDCKCSDFY